MSGVVQQWTGRASGAASLTITLAAAAIAADDGLHVDTTVFDNISISAGTPADSTAGSNVWHLNSGGAAWSATFRSIVGSAYARVVVAPTTVTINKNAGSTAPDIAGAVSQITGIDWSNPVNTTVPNAVTGTNPAHTAASSAQPNECWMLGITHDGSAIVPTQPSGFTLGAGNFDGSAGEPIKSAYELFSATQTSLAPQWTIATSANYTLCLTAYRMLAATVKQFSSVRAFQEDSDPRAYQVSAFQRPDPTDAFITPRHAFFQELAFQRPDPVEAFQDQAFDDEGFQEAAAAFEDAAFQGDGFQQDERPPTTGVSGAGTIAPGAAFGTTQVQRQARTDGAGITTGEAFGTVTLFIRVGPSGLASVAAVGQPTLNRVSIAGRISTGEAFGTQKAQRQVREDGTGIQSGVAFGVPQVELQEREFGIPTGEAFGAAHVQRQVWEDGTGIPSGAALGKPAASNQIGCAGIPSGATVGTLRLLRVTLAGIATAEAFGRPTVTIPPQPTPTQAVGGHGQHTGPKVEPHYILERQRRDQPAAPRRDPEPIAGAGGITSTTAFGYPSLTLLAPPKPPIDYLSREEEELLGIMEFIR